MVQAQEDTVEEDLLEDEEDGEATVESEDEQGDEEMAVTDTDTDTEEGVTTIYSTTYNILALLTGCLHYLNLPHVSIGFKWLE